MKKIILLFFCMMAIHGLSHAQSVGVKTNIAHWVAYATPNAGLEFALGRQYTLEMTGGYNWFAFSDTKTARHWIVQPELRYWLCESYNGHFFGLHALGGEFNVGGLDIPVGRLKNLKEYRYEGTALGAGLSYGYQWPIAKRWNFELNLGAGYILLDYDKYPCTKCGEKVGSNKYNYFGVTKAAVSLIYFIK